MTKAGAFTLIEVLVTLSLLAAVLFFTIPIESTFHQKNQAQVICDEIKSAIRFAKTQALISGNNLVLRPLLNTNDWSQGMLLFKDNNSHRYTSGDAIIYAWQWSSPNINVVWQGYQSNDYLHFSPDVSQSAVNGSFLITTHNKYVTKLVVNRLGRIKTD